MPRESSGKKSIFYLQVRSKWDLEVGITQTEPGKRWGEKGDFTEALLKSDEEMENCADERGGLVQEDCADKVTYFFWKLECEIILICLIKEVILLVYNFRARNIYKCATSYVLFTGKRLLAANPPREGARTVLKMLAIKQRRLKST